MSKNARQHPAPAGRNRAKRQSVDIFSLSGAIPNAEINCSLEYPGCNFHYASPNKAHSGISSSVSTIGAMTDTTHTCQ